MNELPFFTVNNPELKLSPYEALEEVQNFWKSTDPINLELKKMFTELEEELGY